MAHLITLAFWSVGQTSVLDVFPDAVYPAFVGSYVYYHSRRPFDQ